MTGKERILRILNHEKPDRIGLYEHFWSDTFQKWQEQGKMAKDAIPADVFGFDLEECAALNMVADLDFVRQKVAEDEDTVTYLDGNGATLRRHKFHDTTPEHIDFAIKTREDWEEKIKPLLTPDPRRINFERYRAVKQRCADAGRFFAWNGLHVFECIHPVTGHVNMLMSMIDDPEWVEDMVNTYNDLILKMLTILFEQEGYPDGIWFYEDMGYKGSPFMSPAFYQRFLQPAHARSVQFAHDHGCKFILHSCGFVEPLMPYIVETGIDCLQAIEVKAGMDLLKLNRMYGDRIAFMGGIDVRALYTNDRACIDKELESKIPFIKEGFNFILHSDHSIPYTVDFDTYRYFIDKGLELGRYY